MSHSKLMLLLEDSIGVFSKSGDQYFVEVYPNDNGFIPHFHLYNKDKSIDTCIEISDNRYFRHDKHTSTLTDGKVRKALNDFLREEPIKLKAIQNGFKTNWEFIKFLWNSSTNRNLKVYKNSIPDYKYIYPEIKNDPRLKNSKHK